MVRNTKSNFVHSMIMWVGASGGMLDSGVILVSAVFTCDCTLSSFTHNTVRVSNVWTSVFSLVTATCLQTGVLQKIKIFLCDYKIELFLKVSIGHFSCKFLISLCAKTELTQFILNILERGRFARRIACCAKWCLDESSSNKIWNSQAYLTWKT